MTERAVPFHCPFCGGENLYPHEAADPAITSAWECRECLRAFTVKMLGLIRPAGNHDEGVAP
jgi:hypothetical protein